MTDASSSSTANPQKPLRIAFMGTPDFSVPALKALHEHGQKTGEYHVVCVYSQPPRPKGRGHKVQPSPVHAYADAQGIPVFHPKSLKSEDAQAEFIAHDLDIAVVAAYGLLLPKAVLDAPTYGCVNIHASILPRWRGASPIHRTIWAGDEKSGVTLMQMDEGLDTGNIISIRETAVTADTTAQSLHDELSAMGGEMILDLMDVVRRTGKIESTPQDDALTTYAPLLTKEDGHIDWGQNAAEIDCQIRALNPWPGTYTGIKTEEALHHRFKIPSAHVSDQTSDKAYGTLLDKHGHIACGDGNVLKIERIQPAGKKAMDFASALNGGYITIGDVLS